MRNLFYYVLLLNVCYMMATPPLYYKYFVKMKNNFDSKVWKMEYYLKSDSGFYQWIDTDYGKDFYINPQFRYEKIDSVIFLIHYYRGDSLVKEPLYSLVKGDSVLYLNEFSSGLKDNRTEGYVKYNGDTVMIVENRQISCYKFSINGSRFQKYIYLDKDRLIPIEININYTSHKEPAFKRIHYKGINRKLRSKMLKLMRNA